ncbi:MAG: hypothetical protein U0Q10_14280 [Dermatophilaceae bacterium]
MAASELLRRAGGRRRVVHEDDAGPRSGAATAVPPRLPHVRARVGTRHTAALAEGADGPTRPVLVSRPYAGPAVLPEARR